MRGLGESGLSALWSRIKSVFLAKSGGTMEGPLTVTGGDSVTAGKIILSSSGRGQITDNGTYTLFGFTAASNLTVGHGSYNLLTRGKTTRPIYNSKEIALLSDVTAAVGGNYLPTTGGEVTGTVTITRSDNDTPLYIKSANLLKSYIGFVDANGTVMGYYGFNGEGSPRIFCDGVDNVALHSGNFSEYAAMKSEIPTVPTNVSAFSNDAGYAKSSDVTAQLSKKANDYTIEIYNGTGGNPKPVRFASFNYSTCNSENGIAAKIGMVSGHGNGTSYAFLQDAIIRVRFDGAVEVDNLKYYGADTGTYDGAVRQYGDIFWLTDATNKIVDFYVLMGQYARLYQTPWKRLTYSSGGTVTQHTSCTVYSSGTKSWANNSNIAMLGDIPSLSGYATEAWVSSKNYLTAVPSEYVTETELADKKYLTAVPSEYVTESELNDKGYLTQHQDLSSYAKKSELPTVPTKVSAFTNDAGYMTSLPYRLNNYQSQAVTDPNSATETGFYYVNGATNRPPFSQSTNVDYRVLTTAYSDQWLQQIATDFRCVDVFVRRRENGAWTSWKKLAYSDDVLPISGGTVAGGADNETPLYLKSVNTANSYLGFVKSDGTKLGFFGFEDVSNPVIWCNNQSNAALHSGNIASYAAAPTHGHDASDITSGTLPLSIGGTGAALTKTNNAIIRFSGSGNYFSKTATGNGAFYATASNGSPKFGTLPVAQGGTGATDAATALSNLGGLPLAGGTVSGSIDFSNSSSWITPYLLAFKNADTGQSPTYPYTGFYQWGDEWQVNARDASNVFAKNVMAINLVSGVANFMAVPTVNGSQLALKSDVEAAAGGDYLPLSGGTVTAQGDTPLYVRAANHLESYVGFKDANDTVMGYLGYAGESNPVAWCNGKANTVLHSGNCGSYALPLSGGSLTGAVMQTVAGNPYYGLNDGTTNWYLQAVQSEGKVGLGPTWTSATKWDASGNMTVVGSVTASSFSGTASRATADGSGNSIEGTYAKKTDIPSLSGYATQDWVNGRGFLTTHQSLAGYATEAWVEGKGYLTSHQSLAGYATESWVNGRGFLTAHQSLAGYATTSQLEGYMPKGGGKFTGPVSFQDSSLPGKALEFVCGIDAFAAGGQMGWQSKGDFLSGYATQSWVNTQISNASISGGSVDLSDCAKLSTANVYNGEQKFQNSAYCPTVTDTASGVGCAFKASRGMVNEMLTDKLIMTASTGKLPFYSYNGTSGGQMSSMKEVASIDSGGSLTATGKLTQGTPSSDSSVSAMNRFQSDLFVQGDGAAPNVPQVAGFYLGKSQTDENRHMDIVSGGSHSYIDFNKAGGGADYDARFIVNVSNGLTEFRWGGRSEITQRVFDVKGTLRQNGADVALKTDNKVLWSGAAYMGSGHTATLSEAISAQQNGVILVWSWYNGSAAENMNFITTAIPKHFPSAHSACGINCSGLSSDGNMWKYVYIYDTQITGYSGNTSTSSCGGASAVSGSYVLRYVIGY